MHANKRLKKVRHGTEGRAGKADLQLYVAEALLRGVHGEGAFPAGADLPALQLPDAADDRLLPRPLPRHHAPAVARPGGRRDPPRLHPRQPDSLPPQLPADAARNRSLLTPTRRGPSPAPEARVWELGSEIWGGTRGRGGRENETVGEN